MGPIFSVSVDGRRSVIVACDLHTLGWLAGLLEAEGSFMCGPPSKPNLPRVSIQMTDLDVVEKLGCLFGISVGTTKPANRPRNKIIYSCVLQGGKAVVLMKLLKPLMGKRRQAQIDKALASYKPSKNYGNVYPTHDQLLAHGVCSAQALAKRYGVSKSYIVKQRAKGA